MGYALWHRGDKPKTFEVGRALLDFGRKQGDYRARGMGYCCIGWSHLIGGDLTQATPVFEKAVQISVDPWFSLFPKLALAYGLIGNGNVNGAEKHILDILGFSQRFGAEFAGKPALFFHGMVLVSQGRFKQGLQILEESCQSWKQNGCRLRYAACGSMLANVYAGIARKALIRRRKKLARHTDKKATAHFQDSIESAGQIGANAVLGRAYRDWGRLYSEKGDTNKAAECFAQAAIYSRLCGADAFSEKVSNDKAREIVPDCIVKTILPQPVPGVASG
jgi:tetratricopeptide (TPR) repeat protein